MKALLLEISSSSQALPGGNDREQPETIYLGGGTPSVLEPEDIGRILAAIGTERAVEVTIEANPGDVTKEKARAWLQAGVNRVSMGVQSFQDELLCTIGRRHTAAEAKEAIRMLREAGFENLSIDLMYGLPGQTMAMWESDVQEAIATDAEHVSCYCLSYEEGTPLWHDRAAGRIQETDEDTENAMYDHLCQALRAAGYEHYEVSNFAKPGKRAVHNSNYWNDTPYCGYGAGAHSYDGKRRFWNPSDLRKYIEGVLAQDLLQEEEVLTDEQQRIERIMLGLRTAEGIAPELPDTQGRQAAERLLQEGLLQAKNGRLIATQAGLHLLNRIIEQLI